MFSGEHIFSAALQIHISISPVTRSDKAGRVPCWTLWHAVAFLALRSEAVSPVPVPYLLRIRTWPPIHRTSSASPLSLSLLRLLAAFSITRSFGRYQASQPRSVGRSVDVGRLDLRGRVVSRPSSTQAGPARAPAALPRPLFMDAFSPAPVPHNPHLVHALS